MPKCKQWKNEKIHDDIPADKIRNVNINGDVRSIIIKQGTTDNFEFYNADLDEDHQYEVDAVYDEDGNDLNILVTMENADAGNDVRGSGNAYYKYWSCRQGRTLYGCRLTIGADKEKQRCRIK